MRPRFLVPVFSFAMSNPNSHAVVIGMRSIQQIDENVAMINRALAANA